MLALREGIVRYRAALLIASAGMLLSPLGLWFARQVDKRWLGVLFALTLLHVAYKTYRKGRIEPSLEARGSGADTEHSPACRRSGANGRFVWTRSCAGALLLSGGLAGLLSGLLGIGGGFVMVPALQRNTDLPMQAVVATSLAVIALILLASVVASAASGVLVWAIALTFSAGAMAGMLGGRPVYSAVRALSANRLCRSVGHCRHRHDRQGHPLMQH